MPELPEVEVVRAGLLRWVRGRTILDVAVYDDRSIRRHIQGREDFRKRLTGATVLDVARRGKFLWMPLGLAAPSNDAYALLCHLGMSGQMLIKNPSDPKEKHLKVLITLGMSSLPETAENLPSELRFIDQRTFGGLFINRLIPTDDCHPGGASEATEAKIPAAASHIARDPLDPHFTVKDFYERIRRSRSGIKRILLNQELVSGIGNIYADEALWAAKLHFARPVNTLSILEIEELITAVRYVMGRALEAGGTSFDSLYVNVNGSSGYFERSLNVYGREGKPCYRCQAQGCQTLIRREAFMNRSSYSCPQCQAPS